MKLRILIVAVCFIGSLFFAFYLGTLEAMEIVEPEDRIGIIIACPNCLEDSITRYYEGKILVKEECNNCNYTTEDDKKQGEVK